MLKNKMLPNRAKEGWKECGRRVGKNDRVEKNCGRVEKKWIPFKSHGGSTNPLSDVSACFDEDTFRRRAVTAVIDALDQSKGGKIAFDDFSKAALACTMRAYGFEFISTASVA